MSTKNKVILSAINQGIHKSYSITLFDKNNQPLELLNRTVYFTVKKDIDDTDDKSLFQKIIHFTVAPNPSNIFVLNITTAETLSLESGTYPYDIKFSFIGIAKQIQFGFEGSITIEKTVTRNVLE